MSRITPTVSTETALRVVADHRCRSVLTQLIESEQRAVSLEALVTHVAPENPPPEPADGIDTDPILVELLHYHLPRLEDAGLVEYDDRTETVRYRPNERVERLHRFVTTELD